MISAHFGRVFIDQDSGQEKDGFTWSWTDTKVTITCKGYKIQPLTVEIVLDEPWISATVLAPYPVLPELKPDGKHDFYGEEEPTEVYKWAMIPTQRNRPYVQLVSDGDLITDSLVAIQTQSLPDVKTKEEFDSTPPTKIKASFQYMIQFARDPKQRP